MVTIHQPDFMPWLGFFKKIDRADIWIVLDHTTNNPRDAAFWGRRVKILIGGEGKWLSLPLQKPKDKGIIGVRIDEMKYNLTEAKLFRKAFSSVENSYRRAPYYDEIIPLVHAHLSSQEPSMLIRNMSFIETVMGHLEINTKVVKSSEFKCTQSSTGMLVELLKGTGGTTYLCGDGASGYQDDALFEENGIGLRYNNFQHPVYPQYGASEFVPGLSIVDALMNVGFDGVKQLLRSQKH